MKNYSSLDNSFNLLKKDFLELDEKYNNKKIEFNKISNDLNSIKFEFEKNKNEYEEKIRNLDKIFNENYSKKIEKLQERNKQALVLIEENKKINTKLDFLMFQNDKLNQSLLKKESYNDILHDRIEKEYKKIKTWKKDLGKNMQINKEKTNAIKNIQKWYIDKIEKIDIKEKELKKEKKSFELYKQMTENSFRTKFDLLQVKIQNLEDKEQRVNSQLRQLSNAKNNI